MISEKLQKARDFEEKYAPFVPEEERAHFHVTGAVGWINDPNGFSGVPCIGDMLRRRTLSGGSASR